MRGLIGNTLRIGVSAACLVAFIGGVLYLFQHGAESLPDYSDFSYGNAPAEYTTWDGIFAGLAAGNYDILASSTTITPERQQAFDFTIPYYGAVQAVVMPKGKKINSLADLKGLTVGSQIGITGVFVLQKANVGAKIKEYDDIGLAFEDLAAGRIDAVIADDPVAKFYANKREDFAGKFSVAYLHKDPEYFGFCVRKGETELVKRINKAIAAMKADGTEDKLKIKWMGSAD